MSMLINYTWEVLDVARTNKVDVGVGRDMFVANLNNFGLEGAEFYPGADVDYEALSAQWKALSEAEQGNEKVLLRRFMLDHVEEVIQARAENDKAKYYELILAYQPATTEKPQYYLFGKAWDVWAKAKEDGTGMMTALDSALEEDAAWAAFDDARKATEREWFAYTVAPYDKGLIYAYESGNKALFESILATR